VVQAVGWVLWVWGLLTFLLVELQTEVGEHLLGGQGGDHLEEEGGCPPSMEGPLPKVAEGLLPKVAEVLLPKVVEGFLLKVVAVLLLGDVENFPKVGVGQRLEVEDACFPMVRMSNKPFLQSFPRVEAKVMPRNSVPDPRNCLHHI